MSKYKTTGRLYLRREPVITDNNKITVMPLDTIVEAIGDDISTEWRRVTTVLGNEQISGFCSTKYLTETDEPLPLITAQPDIPEAHLMTRKAVTRNGKDWAYPLSEPGFSRIDLNSLPAVGDKIQAIYSVLDFLNVEKSARYAPNSKSTYCNIYAYDITYCLNRYVPRVWWYQRSLDAIAAGANVKPAYGKTVFELNANAITDWFEDFGAVFRWKRLWNLEDLQGEVNMGKIGIIVAQRINLNSPGHIVAVIPENTDHKANRSATGEITAPLQSQAGATNRRIFSGARWWDNPKKFGKFGFWVAEE
jgi:hypothetical protein